MYYVINVSKNGVHVFRTADNDLRDWEELAQIIPSLQKVFTKKDGFEIGVTRYALVGEQFSEQEIKDCLHAFS